jgi:hypothetical protein
MSAGELPMLDIFVSYANIDASVCSRQLGRSFIYNENNNYNGLKFDPCGTPHLIFSVGNLYLGLYIIDSYWLSTI